MVLSKQVDRTRDEEEAVNTPEKTTIKPAATSDDELLKIAAMRSCAGKESDEQQQAKGTKPGSKSNQDPMEGSNGGDIQSILDDPEVSDWCTKENAKAGRDKRITGSGKGETSVRSILDDPETEEFLLKNGKGKMTNETSPSPQDIPSPRLSRGSARGSLPGAYRQGGINGNADQLASAIDIEPSYHSDDANPNPGAVGLQDNSGLAVARAVDEEAGDLPKAELSEQRDGPTNPQQKSKAGLLGGCALVVLLIILVAVLALKSDAKETKDIDLQSVTLSPSSSPSMSPTSLESHLLSLLPDYTIKGIQDPDSVQARAFQWLLDDLQYNPALSEERIVQRFSLACFFYSTGGEGWRKSDLWLNHTAHECDWHNGKDFSMKGFLSKILGPGYLSEFWPPPEPQPVKCNETSGLVQHLWLDQNNLNGPLPLEFYLLTSLQTISLGVFNKLHGPISSHLGQLTALEGLVIDNMEINGGGSIPTQIGLLTNIKGLSLSGNGHTGIIPTQLGMLTKLQTFAAAKQNLQGKMPDVRWFPKLKWMVIQGNKLTGTIPTEIGLIDTLDWFTAGDNHLHGTLPSQLGMLSNMTMISLYFNQLEGTLPTQLGLMTASTLLSFRGNKFSGTIPSQFGLLNSLSVALNLNENPLLTGTIPTQMGLLSNLYQLSFSGNSHTGPIPTELGMLGSLGELGLGKNSFSGTIPVALGLLKESLFRFEVDDNPFLSGIMPAPLCNISGTCEKHALRSDCIQGTYLAFNCTDLLCGCDCSCGAAATNRSS